MAASLWKLRGVLVVCCLATLLLSVPPQSIEYYRYWLESPTDEALTTKNILFILAMCLSVTCAMAIVRQLPSEKYVKALSVRENVATFVISLFKIVLVVSPAFAVLAGLLAAARTIYPEPFSGHAIMFVLEICALTLICIAVCLFLWLRQTGIDSWLTRPYTAVYPLLIACLLSLLLCSLTLFLPVNQILYYSQLLGTLGIITTFFAALIIIVSSLTRLYDASGIPIISRLLLWSFILNWSEVNDNHQIRSTGRIKKEALAELNSRTLSAWLALRHDSNKYKAKDEPYPVFLIATQGGGLYAAYHTAMVLLRIQSSWPDFGEHILGVSSVSGGSLGSAFFKSVLQNKDKIKSKQCLTGSEPSTTLADKFFDYDFLSPLLYMTFFPDFFQRFWPTPIPQFDRVLGLEYAIEGAWQNLAVECQIDSENPFTEGFARSWKPDSSLPALFLNSTEVDNGQPIVVSPIRSSQILYRTIWDLGLNRDLQLSTAVANSARFPVITSSGWFQATRLNWYAKEEPVRVHLVDGGFYDNSGASLLLPLVTKLRESAFASHQKASFHVIIIGDASFLAEEFILELQDMRAKQPRVAAKIEGTLDALEKKRRIIFCRRQINLTIPCMNSTHQYVRYSGLENIGAGRQ